MHKKKWAEFTNFLQNLYKKEDRAALAALRRGLSEYPRKDIRMFPFIYPKILELGMDSDPQAEHAAFLTASLFANWHSGEITAEAAAEKPRNFGSAFALLIPEKKEEASKSIEQRFIALLNAHADDLAKHLIHAVSLLRSKKIPIKWQDLAYGINYWSHPDRFVQLNWAKNFWVDVAKRRVSENSDES